MCSDEVIRVESLGKSFHIYDKPRDRLMQMLVRNRRQYYREFWALQDVSFTVRKGETVGIIGRNGSGKSTLLQMICGTLTPTAGQISVNGKVAALLELGAGFNPEFSGRENVYMAASLYGLDRNEVDERFPLIERFADIGEHIDQPVKTYSSGMYVRLAFAVIAHVDADILVIDEALAVGDAVFTQKCMRFIREFQKTGSLLFVSHDMGSVLNLCQRAVWLDKGRIVEAGESKPIAESYLQYTLQEVYGEEAKLSDNRTPDDAAEAAPAEDFFDPVVNYEGVFRLHDNLSAANGWKSGAGEITSVSLIGPSGHSGVFAGGENVTLRIDARVHQPMASPILGFLVRDRLGQDLFGENTLPFSAKRPTSVQAGQSLSASFSFILPMLPNGSYSMMVSLADGSLHDNVQHHLLHDAVIIQVASSRVRWGLVGIRFASVELQVQAAPRVAAG